MAVDGRVSTGMGGFDRIIDQLRLGDNVVWQVDSVDDYKRVVAPYVKQTLKDKRNLVYVRFGSHPPVIPDHKDIRVYTPRPEKGFESFADEIHQLMEYEGRKTFYVFDCLTDLLEHWHSDLMIGNFFKVTCPYLFELDTIAYFAIKRKAHTNLCIAGIRETTQLLLDLYHVNKEYYIHPLKVWERYSPTMFFPHLLQGEDALSITSSVRAAELFSGLERSEERLDHWNRILLEARELLEQGDEDQEPVRKKLMNMLIGKECRMFNLCDRYFSLEDLLQVGAREVGSGFIGGKSVGMLLARKILEKENGGIHAECLEPHDSFYLGSDIYYTYVVQNGWWKLRKKQKKKDGYFKYAPELQEKLRNGTFPPNIRQSFIRILEYFGQSPIIVRSSSLLEDNFGNAFAGKYESVFCVNQGSLDVRYKAFEQAVRAVYASTMSPDALQYRLDRGLFEEDEQMAILVQRVSGDHYGELFFPHLAGVGNSSNLYVWDKGIDMDAGMLRLVFGLGTRAVDRTVTDYARIVTLDKPERLPLMDSRDLARFSQRYVDVLSISENKFMSVPWDEISRQPLRANVSLFASVDHEAERRLRARGHDGRKAPTVLDFQSLLKKTDFAVKMKDILSVISSVYEYPVDIEFTANFREDSRFYINLVQCRPLQTRGLGRSVGFPENVESEACFFASKGHFMGGNVKLGLEYAVYVHPKRYLEKNEQEKYSVARAIGKINRALKDKRVLLAGPGRWGTTTPSLGVPVHFSEISHMDAICEISSMEAGFMPELSYGSHFFQDLVEAGIFYAAIFDGREGVILQPEYLLERDNILEKILPECAGLSDVIHVAPAEDIHIYSDIVNQRVLCR
ncbi:PEP/pyruvate-binding domain-containing protein [Balneolaceae bacterium ANBcel3]|nr:PEP/pyruvate-binding domain-containing protein [Balneolaceae bacterium ANBcel3]